MKIPQSNVPYHVWEHASLQVRSLLLASSHQASSGNIASGSTCRSVEQPQAAHPRSLSHHILALLLAYIRGMRVADSRLGPDVYSGPNVKQDRAPCGCHVTLNASATLLLSWSTAVSSMRLLRIVDISPIAGVIPLAFNSPSRSTISTQACQDVNPR